MKNLNVANIRDSIEQGHQIRLKTFALLDRTEDALEVILTEILNHYGRPELISSIYTAVKELAVNAVKANIKRIVFQKNALDINLENDCSRGHMLFREFLDTACMRKFARDSKRLGYAVVLDILPEDDYFIVEVRNNSLITTQEKDRIRKQLSNSMTYEDLAKFYSDHGDDSEGAGMGVTMLTGLLSRDGIKPDCFTIFTDDIYTVARLEIPIRKSDDTVQDPEEVMVSSEEILA